MIELGFRNKDNNVKSIYIEPNKTALASIWLEQLDHLLKTHDNKIFQKNFSLLGFKNNLRTIDHICDDLDRSIKIINGHGSYTISEDFSPLRSNCDQELLNILHHHFEVTQGQLWNPGSLLANSNGEVRLAICYLNHCCHELEALYETLQTNNNNGYFYYNLLGITDRIDIDPAYKSQFTREMTDGMVYLHYAQTGKTWYEAYLDNDEVVEADGISEHRVISGEFNCYFGPGFKLPNDENFTNWLKSKGVDPTDEQLALGYAPVGKIIGVDKNSAADFFAEYNDFYFIKYNNTVTYDYYHNDDSFVKNLSDMWNKWQG